MDFSDDEDVSKSQIKDDEDSDFVLDEGDDSASDWEMEGRKSSQKKVKTHSMTMVSIKFLDVKIQKGITFCTTHNYHFL